jgi:hypothetical protein
VELYRGQYLTDCLYKGDIILTIQLLRGLEGEVRLYPGERVAQTAGGREGGTGPGYGESLSSLSVDLRMINYSISFDQAQHHNLRKKYFVQL